MKQYAKRPCKKLAFTSQNGMKYKSTAVGEKRIPGGAISKLGSNWYRSIKKSISPPKRTTIKRNAIDVVYLSNQIMQKNKKQY